jgi:N-acylneuraminate cytidylyltransferase
LPGKNSMRLPLVASAQPLVCYSIDHAQAASRVSRVIVSTDGESIAAAARRRNVEVVMRPPALADDDASVQAAVQHAVVTSADRSSIIVILYANVPVRPPGLIDAAVDLLVATRADSVQSYCNVGKHHPYWMVRIDDDGRVSANTPNEVHRRQDLPPLYLPDGGVIAVRRESLLAADDAHPHAFLGRDRRGILNPEGSVIDIDSPLDAIVAGAVLSTTADAQEQVLAHR